MGLSLKSVVKAVKRTVKKVGNSVTNTVKGTANIPIKLVQGDVSGAVKSAGQAVGGRGNLNLADPTLLYRSTKPGQKILKNRTLNALTLNTGNEIVDVNTGFNRLENKQDAGKKFWQSGAALGAKVGAGALAASYAPALFTAKNAVVGVGVASKAGAGNYSGAAASLAGADGTGLTSDQIGYIKDASSFLPSDKRGQTAMLDDNFGGYAEESSSNNLIPLALMAGGIFILIKKRII